MSVPVGFETITNVGKRMLKYFVRVNIQVAIPSVFKFQSFLMFRKENQLVASLNSDTGTFCEL